MINGIKSFLLRCTLYRLRCLQLQPLAWLSQLKIDNIRLVSIDLFLPNLCCSSASTLLKIRGSPSSNNFSSNFCNKFRFYNFRDRSIIVMSQRLLLFHVEVMKLQVVLGHLSSNLSHKKYQLTKDQVRKYLYRFEER